ncbi:MAG: hypothetical protein M3O46_19925 [Myxococcota bacterium]|nr:hypothetical protein [Myxococcota bacterium]
MPPFGLPVAPPVASAPAGGAGAGAWTTLLDLDFTAQPTQVFAADGVFVIAGKNWTKVNSASEGAHMNILNGTGLQMPGPNGALNVAGVGCPYLWLPLSAILGSVVADWATAVRIYASLVNETFVVGHAPNGFVVGICNDSAGGAQDNGIFLLRGTDTGGGGSGHNVRWARLGANAQSQEVDDSFVPAAGNGTICFEMARVGASCVAPQGFHAAPLAAGAVFPALSAFKPDVSGGNTLQVVRMGATVSTFAQMGVLIGASSQGGGGYSGGLQRLRVDVRP